MLTIDGGSGEGGGQVVRTALSLAALLGRPVQITNIRAGRKQPGLRPQHVQSVRAAAAICNARLEGAEEHSRELRFEPQTPPQPGGYGFEIGTAGAVIASSAKCTSSTTGIGCSPRKASVRWKFSSGTSRPVGRPVGAVVDGGSRLQEWSASQPSDCSQAQG